MQTRGIGKSDLVVSAIGLGAMPLSIVGRPEEKEAIEVILAALEAGMTWIDTADVYCIDNDDIGHNERLIAKALAEWADRESVVVATKGGLERPGGGWVSKGDPAHLKKACEASLEALGVEVIDLYQLHSPDGNVPFAESVGALAELRDEGKIRHVGLSNVTAEQIVEALEIVPIASVQNRCSIYDRTVFGDGVLRVCRRKNIGFIPYSPVGGGNGHEELGADPVLRGIGARYGASAYEVALAWLLAQSRVMLPIPGASKIASARSSARAAKLSLTPGDLADLHRAFPV